MSSAGLELELCDRLDDATAAALTALLIAVVDDGASVGWLAPLAEAEAAAYWAGATRPSVVLVVAREAGVVVGTGQLHLETRANGDHRGEVCKVMVHPSRQRRGLGRVLMERLEAEARARGRTLLLLDTRAGDPSNRLYRSQGFVEVGAVPGYARSSAGGLDATVFYYKPLT